MAIKGSNTPTVLLISRCPPYPLHQGDRLIPYNLARELSMRGYQIDLLAFYQKPEDLADVPYYERYFSEVTLVHEPVRSPLTLLLRSLSEQRRFPQRKSQSWAPEMWDVIEQRLQTRRTYDMIHLFGGVQVFEFRNLVRRFPSIIVPYESYSLLLERALAQASGVIEKLHLRLQLTMARQYESWMFDGFRRTVVVSDKDAMKLKELSPGLPVEVIPNGVDLDYFVPTGSEPDVPTLLFTGNYEYGPNLDAARILLNDIFPKVREAIPEAELLIVGANPPDDLLTLQTPGVRVTGRVPDLRPYFEGASLYVSPLRIGAGIKNKILEAMAMQTAVVATPLSCDGINAIHGKDVILASSNEDMVTAVIRMLQDHKARMYVAGNGRKLIEKQYTWRRVAEAYEAVYNEVIREHSRRPTFDTVWTPGKTTNL